MKTRYLLILLLSSTLAIMSGCGKTAIYSVKDQTVIAGSSKYSEEDVKKAMVRAGASLGWTMHADKPGHILGTFNHRKRMAQVDVNYNANNYNITYYNSVKLGYIAAGAATTDENGKPTVTKEPTIHKLYNKWVMKLDSTIKLQLSKI